MSSLLLQPLLLLEIFFTLAPRLYCNIGFEVYVAGVSRFSKSIVDLLLELLPLIWEQREQKRKKKLVFWEMPSSGLLVFLQQSNNNSVIKIQLPFGRIFAF